MTLKQVQHELDNLHKDMTATRVRDGIKLNLYENFKKRVKVIGDMVREVREQEPEPIKS